MNTEEIKKRVFTIIENPDDSDPAGRIFSWSIFSVIIVNLLLVIADTFDIPKQLRAAFYAVDVISVVIFTIDYILRFWTADILFPGMSKTKARVKFIFTFVAVIDLLTVLPLYIPFLIPLDLRVLQALRIVRLLRFLKVKRYTSTFTAIGEVFKKRIGQIMSSMLMIFMMMMITSILMFNAEHAAQPDVFVNEFSSLWWAVSTLTTIGYGDIYPITPAGQILSGIFAFLSIGLVAIPTGIISAGFVEYFREQRSDGDQQNFCPHCGHRLDK